MRLVAFILRVAGCLVLAAATVLAVGDIARTSASERTRLMSIGEAIDQVGLGQADAAVDGAGEPTRSGVFAEEGRGETFAVLEQQPASIVLGAAGFLLLFAGRNARRPTDRERSRTR